MQPGAADGATLPSLFSERRVATGITHPTAMEFAPDGRLFVCQQGGSLRVIKNGSLLFTPFVTLTVDSVGERGLLGVAFDPNFAANRYVYVYYTATTPAVHNRVSRFTANGDVALAGSEVVMLNLNNLGAINHNGGAIHFGRDGKLYIGVGDNGVSSNAQSLSTLLGKMLRINADGTIPSDNPFYTTVSGVNRAIWAMGLRNPFTFAFQPGSGRLLINDVGEATWEEINEGAARANYGWPRCEGDCSSPDPSYLDPIYQYPHGSGTSAGYAISGGAFYNPATVQFPSSYVGNYFFADYVNGWIRKMDPANGNQVTVFATGIDSPTDLKVGADGSLYYLTTGDSSVYAVSYTGTSSQAPQITQQPASQTVQVGRPATFTVVATGSAPLSYQWQRNNVNISGATQSSYTIASVAAADNGAAFRCIVRNSIGSATSVSAILRVTSNNGPVGTITSPVNGRLYTAGETIQYSGSATDPEDGTLPASRFSWTIVFHHSTHTHPFLGPINGMTSGSFVIPNQGEVSADVWYRIHLTVTDSSGATQSSYVDVRPRTATLSLGTVPSGLQVALDGQPVTTPASVVSVVGMRRTLGVVSPQVKDGTSYAFTSWSDGGAASHTISTPSVGGTYTATYQAQSSGSTSATFASATAISIPSQGVASPYPSQISVSGMSGAISKATVTVRGFAHTYPQDARLLLVGPEGQKTILMSHVGGGGDVSGLNLTFDDSAAALSSSATLASGTYRPTSFASGSFLSPAPAAPYGVSLSVFNNQSPNGTWSLYVMDEAAYDQGRIANGWSLTLTTQSSSPAPSPNSVTVANSASISIPSQGAASPYPSQISVSGMSGTISKATVTVRGFAHTYPQDTRLLLVGPGGQKTLLMAHVGGGTDVSGLNMTFDDSGAALSSSATLVSGTYRPTSFASASFLSPAPASPYGVSLSVFNGQAPNGTWSLYVVDDAANDQGRIASGWSLSLTTQSSSPAPPPNSVAVANATAISIPSQGAASPYPSIITVSGLSGTIASVTATLRNVSHTYPDDVRVLLVAPGGRKSMLISRAGGGYDINNVNLTFSDNAPSTLSDSGQILNGTYKPAMFGLNNSLLAPAPAAPYVASMGTFIGTAPNGTWSLYVMDSAAGDSGKIAGGWTLTISTSSTSQLLKPAESISESVPGSVEHMASAVSLTVKLLADGQAQLSMITQPGSTYLIQASPDLVHWVNLYYGTAAGDRLDYLDAQSRTGSQCFYRVMQIEQDDDAN